MSQLSITFTNEDRLQMALWTGDDASIVYFFEELLDEHGYSTLTGWYDNHDWRHIVSAFECVAPHRAEELF